MQAVYRQGVFLRRCVSVEEIEGYMEESKGVITRAVSSGMPSMISIISGD